MSQTPSTTTDFHAWLCELPKAELHVHIDGTLQASRMLQLAEKNGVKLPYASEQDIEEAYNFSNLQSFLDLYYLGASVLRDEDDFYNLMMDYLLKCKEQNILHTEIFVEPQTYFPNNVEMATMMQGFKRAIKDAKEGWDQSAYMILSFLRHLTEEEALETLEKAREFRDDFIAIGLASSEVGHPPEKFERLYAEAIKQGYRTVAHAGEEGPPEFIWDALKKLKVERVDHGVRCLEDDTLVEYLAKNEVPLTVCPLSNVRLCVYDEMKDHRLFDMLKGGVKVTINSDDPTYFGGFLNENYIALSEHHNLTRDQARTLAVNSFHASFVPEDRRNAFVERVHAHFQTK